MFWGPLGAEPPWRRVKIDSDLPQTLPPQKKQKVDLTQVGPSMLRSLPGQKDQRQEYHWLHGKISNPAATDGRLHSPEDYYWWRLPEEARRNVAVHGIDSCSKLIGLKGPDFGFLLFHDDIKIFARLLGIIRSARTRRADMMSIWEREMLRIPLAYKAHTVHKAVGVHAGFNPRHRAGPAPASVLRLLAQLKTDGADPGALADQTVQARIAAGIEDSTGHTYHSHLNMIEWACEIYGSPMCPASMQTIRRVATVCNNPNTLRGWLAAWRRLHLQRGVLWQGDRDPILQAIRTGTLKSLPAGPPKRRVRLHLLKRVLVQAIKEDMLLIGAIICLAYVFALRIPSELLRQGHRGQFVTTASEVRICNLKRKHRRGLVTLTRSCTCSSDPIR